jgi:TRAP-type C4-dicarboxylate transport system permease small subunit
MACGRCRGSLRLCQYATMAALWWCCVCVCVCLCSCVWVWGCWPWTETASSAEAETAVAPKLLPDVQQPQAASQLPVKTTARL